MRSPANTKFANSTSGAAAQISGSLSMVALEPKTTTAKQDPQSRKRFEGSAQVRFVIGRFTNRKLRRM